MSHTMMVIMGGLIMLAVMLATAKGDYRRAASRFIPLWLLLSILNLLVGVYSAGYSFAEELPILGLVFGVPAALALAVKYLVKPRQ